MRANKPYVQLAFTPGNTCRHQALQSGIPAIAWLHINIQLRCLTQHPTVARQVLVFPFVAKNAALCYW